MQERTDFEVTLGDFSGPLDLLCHLVESREMEVASVKLTDVLSQYVAYLVRARASSLAELAEFFSLASRLLLRKVRALLPRVEEEDEGEPMDADAFCEEPDDEADEETLRMMLERFRPYRAAALHLGVCKEERERHFVRISDDGGPPWFDIGDLHGLGLTWWGLIDEYSRTKASGTKEAFLMEIPDAVPEAVLVERRMDEVCGALVSPGTSTLKGLLANFGPRGLIVTLLALLELSRLGRVRLRQSEVWDDVEVALV